MAWRLEGGRVARLAEVRVVSGLGISDARYPQRRASEKPDGQFITHIVSATPATYAIVLAIVAIDALLPFVQAEATVITAAVLAAQGHLIVWLVVAAAALGGLAGDNASYLVGNRVGCHAADRLSTSNGSRARKPASAVRAAS